MRDGGRSDVVLYGLVRGSLVFGGWGFRLGWFSRVLYFGVFRGRDGVRFDREARL